MFAICGPVDSALGLSHKPGKNECGMIQIDSSKYSGREAQQAETLRNLEDNTYDLLDKGLVVASADTIIYEHYRNIRNAEIWLEQLHWEWLRVNMDFSQQSAERIYYRYILLPYPFVIENPAKRHHLIDFIILNIHLHLWHGVVCIVKFLNPKRHDLKEIRREMNFYLIPKAEMFFGLPSYYRSQAIEQVLFTGTKYNDQQHIVSQWVKSGNSSPAWLFYDESYFESSRLPSWHWNQLRRFFLQLHTNIAICPLCRQREAKVLDHVGPVSKGYYQTLLNFQLLCEDCNRSKSNIEIVADPFALRPFLSPQLQSQALIQTLQRPPPWLGKIGRPATKTRDLAENLGLVV